MEHMAQNISCDYDFSKLKEVPEDSIEANLFKVIDDIDTATDFFKPEMQGFEKYIVNKIKESQKLIVSDGYKLYYAENRQQTD